MAETVQVSYENYFNEQMFLNVSFKNTLNVLNVTIKSCNICRRAEHTLTRQCMLSSCPGAVQQGRRKHPNKDCREFQSSSLNQNPPRTQGITSGLILNDRKQQRQEKRYKSIYFSNTTISLWKLVLPLIQKIHNQRSQPYRRLQECSFCISFAYWVPSRGGLHFKILCNLLHNISFFHICWNTTWF